MDSQLELLKGTLDMLVLKTLATGKLHGYGVSQRIRQISDNVLHVEEGSLYPALHRLERKGLIASQWGISENNRKAKFYELTSDGHKHLEAERTNWRLLSQAIDQIMQAS